MLNKLVIGICDDEQEIINISKEFCQKISTELNIEFMFLTFSSGEEIIQCKETIDILLLDIEMNGMNGIETMHILEDISTIKNILFVSGYSSYIHDSFGTKTKGFVCKPIEYNRLKKEIEKTIQYINKSTNKHIIEICTDGNHILIDTENIMYIQGEGRYVQLVTNTASYLVTENIKVWENKLSISNIQRVHKSYIVNYKYVSNIVGTELMLNNNLNIPIGRKYYKQVKEQFREHLFERMRINGR